MAGAAACAGVGAAARRAAGAWARWLAATHALELFLLLELAEALGAAARQLLHRARRRRQQVAGDRVRGLGEATFADLLLPATLQLRVVAVAREFGELLLGELVQARVRLPDPTFRGEPRSATPAHMSRRAPAAAAEKTSSSTAPLAPDAPLHALPGVGLRTAQRLREAGLARLFDLALLFPRRARA